MLLNPIAVKKLKAVTAFGYWPYTTHERRNELAQMFLEEAGKLLDQKAESTVKHVVESYSNGEISYERYIELIEQVSKEEAARGASYGGDYACNRVFEFAQKALDRAKEQAYALSLADEKKQYEVEKQKAAQTIKDLVQQYVVTLETSMQQHDTQFEALTQKQKEDLIQNQESILEHTKTEVGHIISGQLQEERDKLEREIHEQEEMHPSREAARVAIERVALLEKKAQSHKLRKYALMGLGVVGFLSLAILLLFVSLPQWTILILLVVTASIFITSSLWKSPIPEDKIAGHKRQIALYQAKGGEYAPLSGKERYALLVQRIG